MTEERQTSQGYIIRILQHFATKLRNITNFVETCLDQIGPLASAFFIGISYVSKINILHNVHRTHGPTLVTIN
jgi:hypothetical protein